MMRARLFPISAMIMIKQCTVIVITFTGELKLHEDDVCIVVVEVVVVLGIAMFSFDSASRNLKL